MPYHHLALAVKHMPAIHEFYTRAMGFEPVRVEMARTPTGGRANHYFCDTGDGEFMAFRDLGGDPGPAQDFEANIAAAAGLPEWVNHLAFNAPDVAEVRNIRDRRLAMQLDVMEMDHHWCYSVYTRDPNGTMAEFCTTTASFSANDKARALEALNRDDLDFDKPPLVTLYKAGKRVESA